MAKSSYVADGSSAPIIDAYLVFAGPRVSRAINTWQFGNFDVHLPPGIYNLRLSSSGFRNKRIKNIVLRPRQRIDLGTILLDVADCDRPGGTCNCVSADPNADFSTACPWLVYLARGTINIPRGCGADLDRIKLVCAISSEVSVRFLFSDWRYVLRAVNGAKIGESCESASDQEMLIGDLTKGDDLCVVTKQGNNAHIFLEKEPTSNSGEIAVWVVVRRQEPRH